MRLLLLSMLMNLRYIGLQPEYSWSQVGIHSQMPIG